MRPYTRSLHPDDYAYLAPYVAPLRAFQADMARREVPHREWHPHRMWEYASVLQQLDELKVPASAEIVDVGAGASFFDPYLARLFPNLCCTDSMKYGDVTAMVQAQRDAYGVSMPLYDLPVEDMAANPAIGWSGCTGKFDVTMCISTVEHVAAAQHLNALRELLRITKPGGYIFITSDYFLNESHFDRSPSRHVQETAYTRELVRELPKLLKVEFVPNAYGLEDLEYRGDFIHDAYSFVNVCLRRLTLSPPEQKEGRQ
jgi:SAM-dependent methyltransferase